MDFLDTIPEYIFETIGFVAGICGCLVIAIQVIKEYKTEVTSSLSYGYIVGWAVIFVFWCFYGIRFDAMALTVTNAIATVLQITLFLVVLKKARLKQVEQNG